MTLQIDYVPFATGVGALVEDQTDYAAATSTAQGYQVGIANPALLNKTWRQASMIAAGLASYVSQELNVSVLDDGNLSNLITNITSAIAAHVARLSGNYYVYAGNPNGNVAGTAAVGTTPADRCENTVNGSIWVCLTTGSAATAVWAPAVGIATTSSLGSVQPDGSTITINPTTGVISAPTGGAGTVTGITFSAPLTGGTISTSGTVGINHATTSAVGVVAVDGTTITINGTTGVISATTGGSGNTTGATSSTSGDLVSFSGTTGKVLADSGISSTVATAADVWAGTSTTKIVPPAAIMAAQAPQTLTDAATIAWNLANGINAKVTIGGSRTFGTPTNPVIGGTYMLQINSGAGGFTSTFASCFDFGAYGAPTLSARAGKNDFISLYCYDATTPYFRCNVNLSA